MRRRNPNKRLKSPLRWVLGAVAASSLYVVSYSSSGVSVVPPSAARSNPATWQAKQDRPQQLLADAKNLYWATDGLKSSGVFSAPLRGGRPKRLAALRSKAVGLALDRRFVYFTEDGQIKRVPKGGGKVSVLWRSGLGPEPKQIAVDAKHLYAITSRGAKSSGRVLRLPIGGGKPTVLASRQRNPCALALDKAWVYWSTCSDGTIWRARKKGGLPQRLARRQKRIRALAISGKRLFWLSGSTFAKGRHLKNGLVATLLLPRGKARVLARHQWNPRSLALDNRYLYWVSCCRSTPYGDRGQISRLPLAGGRTQQLVVRETTPHGIAVTGGFLYYSISQFMLGAIRRLALGHGAP